MDQNERKIVWVSYSRIDRYHLNSFKSEIRRQSMGKVDVVFDDSFTDQFAIEMQCKIEASDLQVLLISSAFIESQYCKLEVGVMLNDGMKSRNIRPIALSDFDINSLAKGPIKTALTSFSLFRLAGTPNALSKVEIEYTWKELSKILLNKLGIAVWENVSFNDYVDHINEGRFVPFIGPGCYGLEEDWVKVLPALEDKVNELRKGLSKQREIHFVRSVVESRLEGINSSLFNFSGGQTNSNYYSHQSHLLGLSIAIATAGAAASRIIGKSLSSGKGLTNTRTFCVRKAVHDDDVQSLYKALETAKTIALSLPIGEDCLNGSSSRMCLGANGIAKKLEVLQKCLFFGDKQLTGAESFSSLTLSQLDWLGDLLWHSLRFDLPILPNNDELAFHFSLCQASDCLVPIPLGTAGVISSKPSSEAKETDGNEITDSYEECTLLIHKHLDNKSKNPIKHSNFYLNIAKLLCQPFAQPTQENDSASKKGSPTETVDLLIGADGSRPKHPMAVSVNFDTRLESCLENVEYSVITPVQTVLKKTPYWMLRINRPGQEDLFYLLRKSDRFTEDLRNLLRGPLILKLRGSTSHQLPRDNEERRFLVKKDGEKVSKTTRIENRLLLSSFDYAREFSDPEFGQPRFIKDFLGQPDLVMCFLGYPLDDPDALLGIQRSVWMAEPPQKQNEASEKTRISIGCNRHDGLGNAFLKGLKVEPLGINLNSVAEEITNLPNFQEIQGLEA